jgi:protein TonB
MRNLVQATMVFALLASTACAVEGGMSVPPKLMEGHCITMVSPNYPQAAGDLSKASFVVVRVVVSRSGTVSPVRAISGPPSLEAEAMNAVRLWRYKPYIREGEPLDVTTDVRVDFTPGKPGGIVSHPNH